MSKEGFPRDNALAQMNQKQNGGIACDQSLHVEHPKGSLLGLGLELRLASGLSLALCLALRLAPGLGHRLPAIPGHYGRPAYDSFRVPSPAPIPNSGSMGTTFHHIAAMMEWKMIFRLIGKIISLPQPVPEEKQWTTKPYVSLRMNEIESATTPPTQCLRAMPRPLRMQTIKVAIQRRSGSCDGV